MNDDEPAARERNSKIVVLTFWAVGLIVVAGALLMGVL
jgi:hypothetical protein